MDCGFSSILRSVPIHVHVVDSDGRLKIAMEPQIKLISNDGMKPRNVKRALQLAQMYQTEIIDKWHEFHGQENPKN